MAPIDWETLMVVNPEEMDGEKGDEMFEQVADLDVGEEDDPARLRKLFSVTQALLIVQADKAALFEEEVSEMAKNEGRTYAEKDQKIEELKREVAAIESEKKELQRFGSEGAVAGGRGMRALKEELSELEMQIASNERALRDKDAELKAERSERERYAKRAEDAERDARELKKQNEDLRDDVSDYKRQLDAMRDSMMSRRDEDSDFRDKMTQKNRLMNAALEENRMLAETNTDLLKQLEELKKELQEGRLEIVKTVNDCSKLKEVVRNNDSVSDRLRKENELLRDQVTDLQERVRSKGDADDEIMVQVDTKVEQWKALLGEKEDSILDLKEEVMRLRDQLMAANIDSERASVAALTKAVEDRDRKIETLRKRLAEAVSDMENNVILMEQFRDFMKKGGGKDMSEKQLQKMTGMMNMMRIKEGEMDEVKAFAKEAESDAREKDQLLTEALERMRQYEAGEYGLTEAVDEIKTCKKQINVRDREIEDLTQYINRVELKINDLHDENDSLRDKLGMDPGEAIDLSQFRKRQALKEVSQQESAINLQKEVERQQEEIISLKLQLRKLAQHAGTRAGPVDVNLEEILSERFLEPTVYSKADMKAEVRSSGYSSTDRGPDSRNTGVSYPRHEPTESQELVVQNRQVSKDLEHNLQKVEHFRKDNSELRAKVKDMEDKNHLMEEGLKEINVALKEHAEGGDDQVIDCPSLDKMLAAIEAKSTLQGGYDTSLYLKAQVDNLTGHNEELRKELKDSRLEATRAQVEVDRKKSKISVMEGEIKTLREAGAGGHFQAMPLPEGMAVTSSDVIANINEHLIQTLQELHLKEELLKKMEVSLENYKRKFAVMRHQQGLLYADYIKDKEAWEEAKKKLEGSQASMEAIHDEDKIRIQEFDRLVDTLAQDEVEVRRRLSDMTRKITVLRVNEKALTRRYNAMAELEGTLRKENAKHKKEIIEMEAAVTERLGYLQRFKEMASFKIAGLQKALDDSVPQHELDKANRQFTELTEKYRDLLDKSNSLVVKSDASTGFEAEIKRLRTENEQIKSELQVDKEKLHSLEGAFENMRKQGMMSSRELTSHDVTSLSKRVTMLEMKELNERQRADHAVRMYDQQKQQLRQLEDRNFEIEQKFNDVTKFNLEAQKTERILRDELANCVTKEVSDADRKRIGQLENTELNFKLEISKLKEISDIATTQSRALEAQQISRDKEVLSMRQQLLDFQSQSDEKTVIGKLHRHIVQLQVSEGTAVRKLEDANKKIYKLQAMHLRAEQDCDNKNQTIYHNRLEARSKAKYLKNTVQDLRRKYAGSVPVAQQEKIHLSMVKIADDKVQMEEDLKKTNEERLQVEEKLAELELQHKGLQELIDTIQDGRGAQKVADWHSKMEALRLEELRHKRQMDRQKHQIQFLEQINKKHEAEVLMLEEDKVRQAKEFEERELEWEQREVELERIIHNMERTQYEIAGAANKFEQAVNSLPDPDWPVPKQLEHAITTIKSNVKLIMDAKGEAEVFKKKVSEAESQVKLLERELTNRDRVITELRLRLPATEDRDKIIAKATATAAATPRSEDYESKQAVRVAQSTIQSLQARLNQKEETLQKYQELLSQAREDMKAQNQRHQEEMKVLQQKLHSKSDAALAKFKKSVVESVSKPSNPVASNDQLKRLNELEDVVAEQDNSIAQLREKLKQSRQETQDYKNKYEDGVQGHHNEKESMLDEHQAAVRNLEKELDEVRQDLDEKDQALDMTEAELKTQKEANARAPSTTMKNMVERLKNQLALKEKQHKALSKALTELRADLVTNAQDEVRANMEKSAVDYNIQKLVEKQTKDLQEQIEEVTAQRDKVKKDMKKYKEKESSASSELEDLRHELSKKEGTVRKLKDDRARLEGEVEELERKVERMSTMAKQRGVTEGSNQEVDELRRKNRLLQEELKRAKLHQPEKPYEQQPPVLPLSKPEPDKTARDEAVTRWDESKKWQKMTDRLKGRVKDKEQEIEKLSRANELLKNGLERANRDKESLEAKLKAATKSAVVEVSSEKKSGATGPATHNIEPLRRKNYDLEEEVTKLKRELTKNRDAAFEEVQLRNKFLTEKLNQLEQEMSRRVRSSQDVGAGTVSREAYKQMADKEHELQKQVLKLSEENIELKFEVEQSRKDIPRLKERIDDLQKYVDVLKTEKSELQNLNSARSLGSASLNSLASSGSNVRRIGESGKSQRELEKTIALLKKVIERTQAEKEALLRAPGIVSNEQFKGVQMENQSLKNQLEELRQKMGSTLSERYTSHQKGTAKVMADHDRLRRDLMKEMETNEKLRIKITQQNLQVDQLKKELNESREQLHAVSTGGGGTGASVSASTDGKPWKSAVVTRMYEGKLKTLEAEVEKKNQTLSDVKVLLREAAERERTLIMKNKDLNNQVSVLERFPPGAKDSDSDMVQEYQLARLTIDRLENEKRELLHEIQVLRQATNPDAGGPNDITEDELLRRIHSNDELLTENVELRAQLNASEMERNKYHKEMDRLNSELGNFGPEFFEEIEDLKFNYREAVQKNVQYEDKLSQISQQFGITVNINGL